MFSLIIPEYNSPEEIRDASGAQRWLPIKLTWPHREYIRHHDKESRIKSEEGIKMLRALSQTSRRLRLIVLPLLWAVVHVDKVEELGRLRETFRALPGLAHYVKSFAFSWTMGGDYGDCDNFPERDGTLLDLAFRNRCRIWDKVYEQYDGEIQWNSRLEKWCFVVGDEDDDEDLVIYPAPGKFPMLWDDEEQTEGVSQFDLDGRTEGNGPDGKGPDRLIKNAQQLNDCMTDILTQLSSLETLGWTTFALPMPAAAVPALSRTTLTSICYCMFVFRGNLHAREYVLVISTEPYPLTCFVTLAVPLWEIVGNVQDLTLHVGCHSEPPKNIKEQDERLLISYTLPKVLPKDNLGKDAVHASIASRTVITAARGGKLRHLQTAWYRCLDFELPFAVRSLLPYWVPIEEWHGLVGVTGRPAGWLRAASTLRHLLSHASLWLGISEDSPFKRPDRELTRAEVQSFATHYSGSKMPDIAPLDKWRKRHPVARYLPWLREPHLAQRVADAWNEVVRKGDVEEVWCACIKCTFLQLIRPEGMKYKVEMVRDSDEEDEEEWELEESEEEE